MWWEQRIESVLSNCLNKVCPVRKLSNRIRAFQSSGWIFDLFVERAPASRPLSMTVAATFSLRRARTGRSSQDPKRMVDYQRFVASTDAHAPHSQQRNNTELFGIVMGSPVHDIHTLSGRSMSLPGRIAGKVSATEFRSYLQAQSRSPIAPRESRVGVRREMVEHGHHQCSRPDRQKQTGL